MSNLKPCTQLSSAENQHQPSQILEMGELDVTSDPYASRNYDSGAPQASMQLLYVRAATTTDFQLETVTPSDIVQVNAGQDLPSTFDAGSSAPTYTDPRCSFLDGTMGASTNAVHMPLVIPSGFYPSTAANPGGDAYMEGTASGTSSSSQNAYPPGIGSSSIHHDSPLASDTTGEGLTRAYTFYPTAGFFFLTGPSCPGMRVDINVPIVENTLGLMFVDTGASSQMDGGQIGRPQIQPVFYPSDEAVSYNLTHHGLDSGIQGSAQLRHALEQANHNTGW